ncbi:DUF2334 domain-containing protein [Gracilibacillus suaedae]|uniref:DUF2334 domain-containing protein n=1 Tax=Gracilibacillus suaedae TaxID=2820273 RepID=UPI001ABE7700|nr:DUF2334 domain-containing protein [Gracilibacillus suaedae]
MSFKNIHVSFLILLLLVIYFSSENVQATTEALHLDDRKVSLVYYGSDENTWANVLFLDSTLSGLFHDVDIIELNQMEKDDLEETDILVIYLPKKIIDLEEFSVINIFDGRVLGIGEGAEDLTAFRDWTFQDNAKIDQLNGTHLNYPQAAVNVQPPDKAEVLSEGKNLDQTHSIVIKEEGNSFIGLNSVITEVKNEISRLMYDLFELEEPTEHPAYIRLEDISPAADPELVLASGNYLLDRGIPVYLAVIPVYVDTDSGMQITLEERPKLLEVLHKLVEKGAYVIAHGYTHSYRYDESGEGFEFWDAELNQMITTIDQDEMPEKLKKEDEFSSKNQFENYMESARLIETNYVEMKLEDSIQLLTELGLPPIAFEAPHYTMSSNGYHVTSQYFSALFGQIQASDNNWQVMIDPLFIGNPAILQGMTLYPETVGYVDLQYSDPLSVMKENIDKVLEVPGSVVGGFFHPYLGTDYLEEMVSELESIPNLEWIDIAEYGHHVTTDSIQVNTTVNGEIDVVKFDQERRNWLDKIKEKPFESVLWGIVFITAIFTCLFMIHLATLRLQYRKRLFEERE